MPDAMQIPYHTSRHTVDLMNLGPADVAGPLIATSLAKINRFSGHTDLPWTVAAHSILVEGLCRIEHLRGWALLHDAHEAFIGDITSPALELICGSGDGAAVHQAVNSAKGRLDRAIGSAWACVPQSMNVEIRRADWIALQAERLVFFEEPLAPELTSEERSDAQLGVDLIKTLPRGSDWKWPRDAWLRRAYDLQSIGLLTLPTDTAPSSASLAG